MSEQEVEVEAPTPYRNLWVPLVVVPALIVMVVVLIFVLFSGIVGAEKTPRENLERMLRGGQNESQQAAFNLVQQTVAAWEAQAAGTESEWDIDEGFLPDLHRGWEETAEREVTQRVVLAILMAGLDDPAGIEHLAELAAMDESLDPDGAHRFSIVHALSSLGPHLSERDRERAAEVAVSMLDSPDPGLVGVAVVALQRLPSPVTLPALEGMLQSGSLELRGNAALAMAELGSSAGAGVLVEMLSLEPYEAERAADPTKWSRQDTISESRIRALETLVALGVELPDDRVEALLADPDLNVRGTANRLLQP